MNFHPSNFEIYRSLERHSLLVQQAMELLRQAAERSECTPEALERVQQIEQEGDEILRGAIRQLDRQSIDYPPREDIRRIFYYQDRILDSAEQALGRLAAYGLGVLPDRLVRLACIVSTGAQVLDEALKAFGAGARFAGQVSAMADLENEADLECGSGVRALVSEETDPRRFFMLHQLYDMFDRIVDLSEDSVQVMEDCALKHQPRR